MTFGAKRDEIRHIECLREVLVEMNDVMNRGRLAESAISRASTAEIFVSFKNSRSNSSPS